MLSEMLEDYYETQDEELIQDFKLMLWSSKYNFRKITKYYTYDVSDEKLNYNKELIDLFKQYEVTNVMYCKSFHKTEIDSIDFIRIHINNMFGFLVDRHVYYPSKYYNLILTPRKEYFKTIKDIESGKEVDVDFVKRKINSALTESNKIKEEALSKKINLSFEEYQELVNSFIERIFSNYIPPFEYENEHGWELRVSVDGWNEDNYVVKYFCRSLTGYMRNYIRDMNRNSTIKKRCIDCEFEFDIKSNRQRRCEDCSKKYRNNYQKLLMRKRRNVSS